MSARDLALLTAAIAGAWGALKAAEDKVRQQAAEAERLALAECMVRESRPKPDVRLPMRVFTARVRRYLDHKRSVRGLRREMGPRS